MYLSDPTRLPPPPAWDDRHNPPEALRRRDRGRLTSTQPCRYRCHAQHTPSLRTARLSHLSLRHGPPARAAFGHLRSRAGLAHPGACCGVPRHRTTRGPSTLSPRESASHRHPRGRRPAPSRDRAPPPRQARHSRLAPRSLPLPRTSDPIRRSAWVLSRPQSPAQPEARTGLKLTTRP